MTAGRSRVTGVLLAAGGGRRAGGPKALRRDPDGGSWLVRSASVLLEGGCSEVVVVLGAAIAQARTMLPDDGRQARLTIVEAPDWADGVSRSLASGLTAASGSGSAAVLVHLVDLPDVTADVVRRVLAQAPRGSAALARATYAGRPGHPVLIGSDHLEPLLAELATQPGDSGANAYLSRHEIVGIDCTDLASGEDQDLPE